MAQELHLRLQAHLRDLRENPGTVSIDQRLLDEADLVLPDQLPETDLQSLVSQLSFTLQTIQQDPTPLTTLLQKLIRAFTFADVLSFDPPVNFKAGLGLGDHMAPFNRLMLHLLQKVNRPADAATVASWPEVVHALVLLWLCTADTGVMELASYVILELLEVDRSTPLEDPVQLVPSRGSGQGLMWKRIFGDRDVYGALFEVCDLKTASVGPKGKMSKSEVTLAQARLLEWLPKVARMGWGAVRNGHHEEVERAHGVQGGGLLDFAAMKMVDCKDDVLMHRCLIDFYSELLDATRPRDAITATGETGQGLEYLISKGLHERTAAIYLHAGQNTDIMESMFLYGPAANYIATYAFVYPKHFMASTMPKDVISRLMNALTMSPANWAHSDPPKHDLHLLASLPRAAILPSGDGSGDWSTSPLSLLPSKATNADVLHTLATVFHGPVEKVIDFPESSPMTDSDHDAKAQEAAAARSLYMHYVANNQMFWKDVATHADTVALKDLALSAIRVLALVITANWSTKPEMAVPSSRIATPASGHLAIISPPALEYALPFLLKPAQSFSNLVGGRGDAESAAYKIAIAKFSALQALHDKLASHVESEPGQGFEEILLTTSKRLAEGPMGGASGVGGRIATLEM